MHKGGQWHLFSVSCSSYILEPMVGLWKSYFTTRSSFGRGVDYLQRRKERLILCDCSLYKVVEDDESVFVLDFKTVILYIFLLGYCSCDLSCIPYSLSHTVLSVKVGYNFASGHSSQKEQNLPSSFTSLFPVYPHYTILLQPISLVKIRKCPSTVCHILWLWVQ